MAEVIGELFQKSNGFEWEWRIPGFLSLPEKVGKGYRSGNFFFSDACWELELYPNGHAKESEEWVSLFLYRVDTGPSLTVACSMGIRNADGAEESLVHEDSETFSEGEGWGLVTFLDRAYLVQRRADLAPSELLTIICNLEDYRRCSMLVPSCRRLCNTSLMLRGLLTSEEGADVTFKLEDGELRAHKLILKARSKVFSRMFTTEMRESRDAEVLVPEADTDSFKVALSYMYSGEPEGLSSKNMCKVYGIAHKYELEELAELCVEFMKRCLSVETACDFIRLANVYQETDLKDFARRFVLKNMAEVVETVEWKTMERENPSVVSELLQRIVVSKAESESLSDDTGLESD